LRDRPTDSLTHSVTRHDNSMASRDNLLRIRDYTGRHKLRTATTANVQ